VQCARQDRHDPLVGMEVRLDFGICRNSSPIDVHAGLPIISHNNLPLASRQSSFPRKFVGREPRYRKRLSTRARNKQRKRNASHQPNASCHGYPLLVRCEATSRHSSALGTGAVSASSGAIRAEPFSSRIRRARGPEKGPPIRFPGRDRGKTALRAWHAHARLGGRGTAALSLQFSTDRRAPHSITSSAQR
jgi:hypothetical protein